MGHPVTHRARSMGRKGPIARGNKLSAHTFGGLAEKYLTQQGKRVAISSFSRLKNLTSHLLKFFGSDTPINSISRDHVRRFMRQRARRAAPGSVGLEIGLLKRMFVFAMSIGETKDNPADGIEAPQSKAKVRYISQKDFKRILEASPDWLHGILLMAVATGLKRHELLTLPCSSVDLKRKCITLPGSKRALKSRTILLNDLAKQALTSVGFEPNSSTRPIFTHRSVTSSNVPQAFRRACESVGIDDFSFNDLRSTAAIWMLESGGAGINAVAEFLGYKDPRAAMRFIQRDSVSTDTMRAFDRLAVQIATRKHR